MSRHEAVVEWEPAGDFASGRYSRAHRWRFDGGAEVAASASPRIVPPPLSDPAAIDPEEALIASVASCHMLWFLSLAQAQGLVVTRYRDAATGTLGKDADGRIAFTSIDLSPVVAFASPEPDAAAIEHLHREAHARCFIANSLKTRIVVKTG